LISRSLASQILSMNPHSPESRLDILLREEPSVVRVEVSDPKVVKNFNSREDYELYR
jgi:hypothetical protein